jgi:CDP-4-dehydro-6-deoxyglucose reductase
MKAIIIMSKPISSSFKAALQSIDSLGMDLYRLRFSQPVSLDNGEKFDHQAGQFCYIGVDEQSASLRPYSIANAPYNDFLEFHVRDTGVGLSRVLCGSENEGKTIYLSSPAGSAHYFEDDERDIVLFSGGTGYAPIRAMIERLEQRKFVRKVTAFIGARDVESLYMLDEIMAFSKSIDGLSVHFCADKLTQPHDRVQEAFLNDLAHSFITDYADKRIYIAGPAPMVINVRDYILKNGAHDDLIHVDHENIAQYLKRNDLAKDK